MRKLIMFNMLSIDGFFEGPNHDISWHTVDNSFNDMAKQQQQEFDTLLFGNTTYTLFEEYWPKALVAPETSDDDRVIAKQIDDKKKIVISRSRKETNWNNSEILKGDLVDEVKKLKEQEGSAIMIYGSGTIVRALTDAKLIDEYRIMISPTILGKGINLFEGVQMKSLKLIKSQSFGNGNVYNWYTL